MVLTDRLRRSRSIYTRPKANMPVRHSSYTVIRPGVAPASRSISTLFRPTVSQARRHPSYTVTRLLSRPVVRPLSIPSVRPLTSSERTSRAPVRTLTPSVGVSSAGGVTAPSGFDLSGITGQFQGTGQEIVDKIQSFLPTAFKLLLVFIGIKILLWFLGRRR